MRLFLHGGPRTRAREELLALAAPRSSVLAPTPGAVGLVRAALRERRVRPAFVGTFGAWALTLLNGPLAGAGGMAGGARFASREERRAALSEAVPIALRDASERLRLGTRALLATRFPEGRDGLDEVLEAIAFEKGTEWASAPEFPALYPDAMPARGGLDLVGRAYDGTLRPRLDEEDAVAEVVRLLRMQPERCAEVAAHAGRVLVADLEETRPLERALLQRLAPPEVAAQGDAFARVGRRGPVLADAAAEFTRLFPGAQVRELRENARSAPVMLRLMRERFPLFREEAPPGAQSVHAPRVMPAASETGEARFVTAQVRDLLAARVPGGRVAVLFPGAAPPAHIAEALAKARVPVTRLTGLGDPSGETAAAVSAHLQWAADPLFQFRRSNREHLALLDTLLAAHRGVSLEAARRFTGALGAQGDAVPGAQAIAAALQRARDPAVGPAVERLLAHRQDLRKRYAALAPAEAVREARAFLDPAVTAPPTEGAWDHEFLGTLEALAREEESVSALAAGLARWCAGDAVAFVPFARAKGHVWDEVLLVGCAAATLPRETEGSAAEAEARAFVTAATAAGKRLVATCAGGPASPFVGGFTSAPASGPGGRGHR